MLVDEKAFARFIGREQDMGTNKADSLPIPSLLILASVLMYCLVLPQN